MNKKIKHLISETFWFTLCVVGLVALFDYALFGWTF